MAMTSAERMAAYRLRKKEAGFKQVNKWQKADETVVGVEQTKKAVDAKWQEELKQEQLSAARKEGRRLAKLQDTSRRDGYIGGICDAASFFIRKDRVDIAQHLLKNFMIDRAKAEEALQRDKRTKSMTLEYLDKHGAWREPPPIMR
jgi:hypothetical protein